MPAKKFLLMCSKPGCNNTFIRFERELKKVDKTYCSRSCAVSINNKKYPKRVALTKRCKICGKIFVNNKDYCSRKCGDTDKTITKEEIISLIKKFYLDNGRIPFKLEFTQAKPARLRFGSWNNAIKMAGFLPNPVKFAHKYFANDGHKCDSLAEKIIDDWLTVKNIFHLKSTRYPDSKFTSDFKIGDTYLEFFGLSKSLKKYDRLMKEKLQMVRKNKLKLIKIYPHDLFPKNKLAEVLSDIQSPQLTYVSR